MDASEYGAAFGAKEIRLLEMRGAFIAFREGSVNIDDLLSMEPGSLVRCKENPRDCLAVYVTDEPTLGCVAGWISEDDDSTMELGGING
jgi:hypothetical protein